MPVSQKVAQQPPVTGGQAKSSSSEGQTTSTSSGGKAKSPSSGGQAKQAEYVKRNMFAEAGWEAEACTQDTEMDDTTEAPHPGPSQDTAMDTSADVSVVEAAYELYVSEAEEGIQDVEAEHRIEREGHSKVQRGDNVKVAPTDPASRAHYVTTKQPHEKEEERRRKTASHPTQDHNSGNIDTAQASKAVEHNSVAKATPQKQHGQEPSATGKAVRLGSILNQPLTDSGRRASRRSSEVTQGTSRQEQASRPPPVPPNLGSTLDPQEKVESLSPENEAIIARITSSLNSLANHQPTSTPQVAEEGSGQLNANSMDQTHLMSKRSDSGSSGHLGSPPDKTLQSHQ